MTGWRIGYAAGPAEIIKAMKKVQSQSTSNPVSISQVAAQAALEGPQECISEMLVAFKERHDYVVDRLNKIPGVNCLPTDGTFYLLPGVQEAIKRIDGVSNDLDLAEHLIEKAGVAWCRDQLSVSPAIFVSPSPPAWRTSSVHWIGLRKPLAN